MVSQHEHDRSRKRNQTEGAGDALHATAGRHGDRGVAGDGRLRGLGNVAGGVRHRGVRRGLRDPRASNGRCCRAVGGRWNDGGGAVNLGEVGTADARLVGVVDHKAPVAEEGADALSGRRELVIVRDLEGIRRDLAVLAAQVTNLARLGELGITCGIFAAEERVQVGERLGAVSIAGDRINVDMVRCSRALVTAAVMTRERNLLKGPPSLGRLLNWTLNQTPMPSGLEVAVMLPLTLPPLGNAALSKAVSGSVAA